MLLIKKLVVGQLATNCYLVQDSATSQTLILDPGDDGDYIINTIQKDGLKPLAIVATHGHFDHILAAFAIQRSLNIPFLMHQKDLFLLKIMSRQAKYFLGITSDPPPSVNGFLKNKQKIKIGKDFLTVNHTPGHTPGSINIIATKSKCVFVGDMIFEKGFIGRTDHKYSSKELLLKSVRNLILKYKSYRFYPGHGEEFTGNKTFFSS